MTEKRKQDALNFISEAEKDLKTSFFKWKPDFLSAAPKYEKAANIYRGMKMFKEAGDCFKKAGDAYQHVQLPLPAARQLEAAIDNYTQSKSWQDVIDTANDAIEEYKDTEQLERVGICMTKQARAYEEIDKAKAIKTYKQAVDVFVEYKKTSFMGDFVQKTISFGVKNNLVEETVDFLDSVLIAHVAAKKKNEICKDRLHQILIYFIFGKMKEANEMYNDRLDDFDGSDEQIFAAQWMDAYENGKVKTFEKLKGDAVYRFCNQELVMKGLDMQIPQEIIEKIKAEKKAKAPKSQIQFNPEFFTEKETVKTEDIGDEITEEQLKAFNALTADKKETHVTQDQMKRLDNLTANMPLNMGQLHSVVQNQDITTNNFEDDLADNVNPDDIDDIL